MNNCRFLPLFRTLTFTLPLIFCQPIEADDLTRAFDFQHPVANADDYTTCFNPFLGYVPEVGFHLGDDYNSRDPNQSSSCALIDDDCGDSVHSTAPGRVTHAGAPAAGSPNSCSGVRVQMEHLLPNGGKLCSQYLHFQHPSQADFQTTCDDDYSDSCTPWQSYSLPGVGSELGAGIQLGRIGNTGHSSGSHLHLELRLDWPDCRFSPGGSYVDSLFTDADIRTLNSRLDPNALIDSGVMSHATPLVSRGWVRIRNNFSSPISPDSFWLYRINSDFASNVERRAWNDAVSQDWLLDSVYSEDTHQEVSSLKSGGYYWLYTLEDDLVLLSYAQERQDFFVGDTVETLVTTNIRSSPGIEDNKIGTQAGGSQGTIQGGPNRDGDGSLDPNVAASSFGYTWVDLAFPSSPSGWAATILLRVLHPAEDPPAFCPAPSSSALSSRLAEKSTCEPGSSPSVFTEPAGDITESSATLNLSTNPNGSFTSVWFKWGTSSTSLTQSTSPIDAGEGTSTIYLSSTIGSLDCETRYYFQAWADGAGDPVAADEILDFETDACSSGGDTETQELIQNGDFVDEEAFWDAQYDFHASDDFSNYHSSPGYAYLSELDGDPGNGLYGTLEQEVTLPSNALSATLSYWVYITTYEPSRSEAEDFLNATLQDSTDNFLYGLEILSNQDYTFGYIERTFNLDQFIGQTIQLDFLGTTNDTDPTVFRIDDVSLEVMVPVADMPTVTTLAADQVEASSARLNMEVNPNGADTDVWFELEPNDSTPNNDTPSFGVGSGTATESFSYTASGLECQTQYYFRANATNSEGSEKGSVEPFFTDDCPGGAPFADTDPADSITESSARLTGEVNPDQASTDAWFEWGPTQSLNNSTSPIGVGSGSNYQPIAGTISGLQCDDIYYFQVVAQNMHGTSRGTTHSFTTAPCTGPPGTQTNSATNITASSADLQGQVDPNNLSTDAWFQWGETSPLGSATPHQSVGSGDGFIGLSETINNLDCETTYYYRTAASNSDGTTLGTTESVTTGACSTCGENDLVLSDLTVSSTEAYEACNSISAGPAVTVEGTGSLELSAPSVSFGDGFSVQSGGNLKVFSSSSAEASSLAARGKSLPNT